MRNATLGLTFVLTFAFVPLSDPAPPIEQNGTVETAPTKRPVYEPNGTPVPKIGPAMEPNG